MTRLIHGCSVALRSSIAVIEGFTDALAAKMQRFDVQLNEGRPHEYSRDEPIVMLDGTLGAPDRGI